LAVCACIDGLSVEAHMRRKCWRLLGAVAASALAVAAATGSGMAAGAATAAGPEVKLVVAQKSITLATQNGSVYMDPGIWVAALKSRLQFDVQRRSYRTPLALTQVIHAPGEATRVVPFPGTDIGIEPTGLLNFFRLTVRNPSGAVVSSTLQPFCPDGLSPERASPDSSSTSPYPTLCSADPFPKSLVWGVGQGWAVDPLASSCLSLPLGAGKYTATETITPGYARRLHISAADATATVKVDAVAGTATCAQSAPGASASPLRGGLPRSAPAPLANVVDQTVKTMSHPPRSALPDLVPLPSWGISTSTTNAGHDLLNFGATVWDGHAPLDVVGYRSHGAPIMKAYQYFWRNGKVIGRTRAGTMGFDTAKGHNHWHFEQFAQYRLLNAAKRLVLKSGKVGFCIAPTEPVDLLEPHAVLSPPNLGIAGHCGVPTSLSVQEEMPVGWGDTYFQTVAGQSFNITSLPDGTYYIEIVANPFRVLRESNTSNDSSLRKVILGGTPGHRTVTVPAWHGIDPES
jgi:hypothetical protein